MREKTRPVTGAVPAGLPAGRALRARGDTRSPDWQLRLCTLRRTAGCPPERGPGIARQRLAAVTPAGYGPRGTAILPGTSLEPGKITLKGAPAARHT
jgi:hypothetical protein